MEQFKVRASSSGKIMGVRGLGKTGEDVVKEWKIEQVYGRRKEFSNKYTDKGNIMEDDAIDFISEHLGYGFLSKNEKYFSNDYFTGTPDVICSDHIIDVKNSFDPFTFPFFDKECPNKDYYYQGQVYMDLVGLDKYKLVYTLMDTPINIIERESRNYCFKNGYDLDDMDIFLDFQEKMTYEDIPIENRYKVFEFKKDENVINEIKKRVLDCREYLSKII